MIQQTASEKKTECRLNKFHDAVNVADITMKCKTKTDIVMKSRTHPELYSRTKTVARKRYIEWVSVKENACNAMEKKTAFHKM